MRHNPHHFIDDLGIVRRLIRKNPWGILVSGHNDQLVASRYPVLLDEDCDELAVFTHVGRPDDELHDLESIRSCSSSPARSSPLRAEQEKRHGELRGT